jgi:DNA-binding transcriptional ArsR family regulator
MATHRDLMKKAKQLLKEKGFLEDEIHEGFWFKNYRVDTVGWSPRRRVAVECGSCSATKRRDLEKFFDEVICLPFEPLAKPVPVEPPTRDTLAKMRLVLVKGDNVVFEVSLSREEWSKEFLEGEAGFMERDFQRFSKLFNALSHENRLRMMKLLIEDEDLTVGFADFIHDLDLNPKLVWENTKKLSESGLLEKNEEGRYRCSEFGEASFIMLNLVLRRLREIFE